MPEVDPDLEELAKVAYEAEAAWREQTDRDGLFLACNDAIAYAALHTSRLVAVARAVRDKVCSKCPYPNEDAAHFMTRDCVRRRQP